MRAGQHSITPRGRIRGRGRGQPVRRSLLRLLLRSSVGKRSRKNEALPSVDEPARPRDGGADQAVTAVHDSYRAPYPDLYLSLPRSDCDRGTLVPRFLAEPKTQKTDLALHGPVHDLCLYFRR